MFSYFLSIILVFVSIDAQHDIHFTYFKKYNRKALLYQKNYTHSQYTIRKKFDSQIILLTYAPEILSNKKALHLAKGRIKNFNVQFDKRWKKLYWYDYGNAIYANKKMHYYYPCRSHYFIKNPQARCILRYASFKRAYHYRFIQRSLVEFPAVTLPYIYKMVWHYMYNQKETKARPYGAYQEYIDLAEVAQNASIFNKFMLEHFDDYEVIEDTVAFKDPGLQKAYDMHLQKLHTYSVKNRHVKYQLKSIMELNLFLQSLSKEKQLSTIKTWFQPK